MGVDRSLHPRPVGITAASASAAIREFGLQEPTCRPFADPYYWAAFVAIGA